MSGEPWPTTPAEATRVQRALRERLVLQPPAGFAPRLAAGADISMDRGSDVGYAGLAVLDVATLATAETAVAVAPLTFPYVPGYLSFRELPPLAAAWGKLARRPDVVIFDGQGYAHPRRFGLACHGGVLFDVPSVGCAKTILVGAHGPLGEQAGSAAPLVHRGETVGMALRLRDRTAPVYVSAGHLMDLDTAVAVVLSVSGGFREPETTRRAHRLVNEARKAAAAREG
jgi:deoxyribonuclease V